ncbi:polycomb protein suz12-B-like [Tigriopus californicus]|nr:polycomb protein suz12-B-like [Tigriopus californicus]
MAPTGHGHTLGHGHEMNGLKNAQMGQSGSGSGGGGGGTPLEELQANHELFLQAFEKPTQIYRYLRTRNILSPIFLNRTLTFMKGRQSRSNGSRKHFKVDTLLERKMKTTQNATEPKAFMTLTFLGFYDKRRERPMERVGVELILLKMAHKKRKESASPVVEVSLGTSEIPVNPSEDHPPSKAPALSIPSESFSLFNGHQTKSYSLLVRVHQSPFTQMTNNGSNQNGEENLEPSCKRRKLLRGSTDSGKILYSELVVYDKHSRCLLTEGEYEVILSETDSASENISPKKNNSSWETIGMDKKDRVIAHQFEAFTYSPTIKFRLSWSCEPAGSMVERPRPLMPRDNTSDLASIRSKDRTRTNRGPRQTHKRTPLEKPPRIVYQFLYNNNSRQQTEAREDLHCPWCSLNCLELYALLKHLKLSHPRFLFTYVPIEEGARIDVSVSELYDSTYVGNPHDLITQPPGFAFSRYGPVQRTSITNVIVCKPKRSNTSLSEFLEIDGENGPYDGQRPFVTGHNRLYHYSTSNLPMPPHAILTDSTEDRVDPPWLMTKICRMIDEFSDVNDGEKDFMKLWNLHIQHYTFVGDCQMNHAIKAFIDEKGPELVRKNLYRNFVVHCCNLFEFGVIGPAFVHLAISRMQRHLADHNLPASNQWHSNRLAWMIENQMNPSLNARKDFSGLFKSDLKNEVDPPIIMEDPPSSPDVLIISEDLKDDEEEEEDDELEAAAVAAACKD